MYENISFESLMERAILRVQKQNSNIDVREGSIIYNALAPAIYEIMGMYIEIDRVMNETFADTASREYLIKRAAERGIIPQQATKAVLKGMFTPSSLEISIGSRFSLENLNYKVIEKIGDGTYQLECETFGEEGNLHFGQLIPIDYIAGLETSELTELLIPGEDEEDTESIRKRYYQSLEAESYGGNKADYKIKVGLIKGVGGVKVYSGHEWNGGGTVKIVITDSNFDIPSKTLIETVQGKVDPTDSPGEGIGIAPIGHIVTIVGVNEVLINISTSIVYQPGYHFEAIKTELENTVDDYLNGLNSVWEDEDNIVVRISQLETRILGVKGVLDIMNTKINGTSENYTANKDSIVKRGVIADGN